MSLYVQWQMGPCFWCGRETYRSDSEHGSSNKPWKYTRDHLIPKRLRRVALTGKLATLLTVTSCFECNCRRGSQSAYRFAAKVKLPPEKMLVIHRAHHLNKKGQHANL
jgi:hypothetical protein